MISKFSQCMHVVYAIKVFYAVVENRTELCKCSFGVTSVLPSAFLTSDKALQFGQKKVFIRFDSHYRLDFFDSIRQSDKFAACTLIIK